MRAAWPARLRVAAACLAALAAALLPGRAMAGPPAPEAAWIAAIPGLAPALRACLEHAGPGAFATEAEAGPGAFATEAEAEPGGTATAAEAEPGGTVMVTLWQAGTPRLCQAGAAGGAILAWRPLAGLPPPDPAAPAFFLERRCADARRIDAPEAGLPDGAPGAVLGWRAYPAC